MTSIYNAKEESTFGILVGDDINHIMEEKDTTGYGLISVIGRRRSMEDALTVYPDLLRHKKEESNDTYDFFAVFDGHGCHKVAYKCRERLHHLVAEEVARDGRGVVVDWESVMGASFARLDAEVADGETSVGGSRRGVMKKGGSTALVVVVIGKEEIVVANCGDCRVLLSRDGSPLPLSRDHKPERPDEKKTVEASGGNGVNDSDGSHVLGVLSTSISIGDYRLKPYVISEPEVQIIKRCATDDFVVIATDGLWDVLENDTVCDLIKSCFSDQASKKTLDHLDGVLGNCSAAAATMLAELAIARGSKDNISVIVVQLKKYQ